MSNQHPPVVADPLQKNIAQKIYFIRGQKVMLDSELAALYGVPTGTLNQAVKRNLERFPADFMFQLNEIESEFLRSQIVILEPHYRETHWKYLPHVFTEQGVAMLSCLLKSPTAVRVNIEIMRAFVMLREMIATNKDLARKLFDLEKKYDSQFKVVFDAIRELMNPPTTPRRSIGFMR